MLLQSPSHFLHRQTHPHTKQAATFLQQKDFLSPGNGWLSFISNHSSISVQQKVWNIILEFDVTRADLEVYALTTISFLSFETEIYDSRQRKRQRSQGGWNPLMMHRAGTKGFALLPSSLLKGRSSKEEGMVSSCLQVHPILRLFSVETRMPQ